MAEDTRSVILHRDDPGRVDLPCVHIHHRAFPELHADGSTTDEVARRLAERLRGAREWASEEWRREALGRAASEVEAFLDRG